MTDTPGSDGAKMETADMDRTEETRKEEELKKAPRRPRALYIILLLVVGAAGAAYWYGWMRNRVTTDNAYVTADTATISSRVSGTVTRVAVDDDQWVVTGDILLELDRRDYETALQKACAALERIQADIEETGVALELARHRTRAGLRGADAATESARDRNRRAGHQLEELEELRSAAQADFDTARRDLDRYTRLFQDRAVSEQTLDHARTAFQQANARLEAVKAQIRGARAALKAASQQVRQSEAKLDTARAERLRVKIEERRLDALKARLKETRTARKAAELNLSYCTIRAPISGYIGRKSVQVGDRVTFGQPLMAVVPLQDAYVVANFKETQLRDIHLGQKALIKADTYPGHPFHGRVSGIGAGTGAAFSLLPPENATGNWVKVVQRVPVKILLDRPLSEKYPLRVGLSLKVTVDTTDKRGPLLSGPNASARP